MLKKFFKTIHIKYSRIFKFIFFLRYLFVIFFLSISLYLTIPTFFNFEKNDEVIKNYLLKNYDFRISKYENIKYKVFPVPRLEFKKVQTKFLKSDTDLNIENLEIFPKIFSIYNLNNFEASKIILNGNTANLQTSNFSAFIEQLLNQEKKISLNNLNLKIINESKLVIKLKNVFFTNFGYKKNVITGKLFDKKFKVELEGNLKSIKFKLLNSGIITNFDLNKKKKTGTFKSKILQTNLIFNFKYDTKKIKIYDFYFRSKNLSFNNETLINFSPFLDIKSNLVLEDFNKKIFKKINFLKLFELKDSIKKINSQNILTYKPKKFSKSFIDELYLKVDMAYGRFDYSKNFLITNNLFKCDGYLNIIKEYPLLHFDCSILINDKKSLLKKFSINTKSNKETLSLKTKGNLNILNKKINFDRIFLNEKNLSKEDLNFFKKSFENILFDKSFLEIFELKKIKKYILEIT